MSILVCSIKTCWDDDPAPFSSDKIRASILDLGYGGARRSNWSKLSQFVKIVIIGHNWSKLSQLVKISQLVTIVLSGLGSKITIREAILSLRRKDFGGAGGGMGGGPGEKGMGTGWTGDQTCGSLSICLSPEPAQSVKVRVRKGWEIQILVISPLKLAIVLASFSALYGSQVVPHAIWWCQVVNGRSLVVPGCCWGLSGGYMAQIECLKKV